MSSPSQVTHLASYGGYMSRAVRTVMIVIGVVALLVGIVWGGQGLGVIPGSFMTGDRTWFYIGLGVAFVGLVLLLIGLRRPKAGS
jgi:hypothetical protein